MLQLLRKLRFFLLKSVVYRRYEIGPGFYCGLGIKIWAKNSIKIGKNFYMGMGSIIESDAVIGDNVIWGNRVALIGKYDHHYQQIGSTIREASAIRDKNYNWKGLNLMTVIENDVWVGYGSILMSGITIGEGSIIAAGSVVTKNIEPYSIYGGVPATKIANRFNDEQDLQQHLKIVRSKYLSERKINYQNIR